MDNALIQITQLPIIEERLRDVKAQWEQTAAEKAALVCNAETIQTVKAARADLTKQYNDMEALRKHIKDQYMAPYEKFLATYSECITEPYKAADAELRAKIEETENAIKAECETKCKEYFYELCTVHGVDFVTWPQMGVKIDMASAKQKTPRKIFDQMNDRLAAIADGLARIERESDPADRAEIIVEYKDCLDVGKAILRVQDRKSRLAAEKASAEERERRKEAESAAVAKVEAAAPPVPAPAPFPTSYPKKIAFTMWPASAEQFAKIRPALLALRDILKTEGIKYE